ncbi:hypothetical protein BDV95DRAFT_161453 [Massariosphaeria phaeospora]|uniref:Extracellular membrane protein CFEM domain-containing protein n=1 Tax=Massariosphaeria phaeospora TaxID=100035 RepID=A0A7C8MFN7_9PLEO|nr:hypothetical protein BDV95DRAFT_161453 [Massariosphaeria phaeospora]
MRLIGPVVLLLLTHGLCGTAAKGLSPRGSIPNHGDSSILHPLENRGGWVDPEDVPPMPQCIAQQDPSLWLRALTACTSKQCTRHFGVICTRHQWLTQLSCLTTSFSADVVRPYLPGCSRSVLANAQLYRWIRGVTGRTWLADVGDAMGLEHLSPASLVEGYAAVGVVDKAPTCLISAVSARSSSEAESFLHAVSSCGFTATTQHTGNAARPWAYTERLRSIIALDSETAAYNFTGQTIKPGDYFDRACFCSAFTIDTSKEPCQQSDQPDFTRARLWMRATCGPKSLPRDWTHGLQTTESAYIPMENWHWPQCLPDIPDSVRELPDQCATDACEVDSSGYCTVKRSVNRSCFCNNISYESCGGSCHDFETRIDYKAWLRDTCAAVPGWTGGPSTSWHDVLSPTARDMIPWRWTLSAENSSAHATPQTCPSNTRKLASLALINATPFLTALVRWKTSARSHSFKRRLLPRLYYHHWNWLYVGLFIAALQLLATWSNAALVRATPGNAQVPVLELMLLWCSMPRCTGLPLVLAGTQSRDLSVVQPAFVAVSVLQLLSAYPLLTTVSYGIQHAFYLGRLGTADRGRAATAMYGGALVWFLVCMAALAQVLRATRQRRHSDGLSTAGTPTLPNGAVKLPAFLTAPLTLLFAFMAPHSTTTHHTRLPTATTPLFPPQPGSPPPAYYDTMSTSHDYDHYHYPIEQTSSPTATPSLYTITLTTTFSLWAAQLLFWTGFISLSAGSYCPPHLGVLTAVWCVCEVVGGVVGGGAGW